MAAKSEPPGAPAEGELVLTRVFDAPRELVFRMWTEPGHMARWWGPHCFTNPLCELDARPGGKSFFEVLNTVTFVERDGKTTQTLRARVTMKAAGADQYLRGMEAGWTQSLERLQKHLANVRN